jgi:HD-GYP domain-containing protein (c-di-GMP phosphodiesterase class II)
VRRVLRLADVLGSLSLATDLGIGAPLETAQRTCLVATHLARRLALPAAAQRDAFYAGLMRHVGCTAWAHEAAALVGGDDHDVIRTFEAVDSARPVAVVRRALQLGRSRGAPRRVRAIAGVLARPDAGARLAAAQCAQAEALAGDLGLGEGVVTALAQMYERHDGRGAPHGLRGEAIAMPARLLAAAQLVEALHRRAGRDATLAEVARRRGRGLSPEVAALIAAEADALWRMLEAPAAEAILDAEPAPRLEVPDERIEEVALAFARFADLKVPHTIGHAPAVAALAAAAGRIAGLSPGELEALRRAALLHDLGAVAVENGVWERPGPLGAAAWEQVRLHAYHGERVLARPPVLAPLAAIVGAHHERPDGSGYHRGSRGDGVSRAARLLAAADALAAMRADRPHRPALVEAAAARELEREAREGRLCRDAVAAVLAAAGHARVRPALPVGLTDREAEVLGLVARGLATKEIAAALAIAARTVKHHIEHIYAKTGVSTRAGAALFAARHDLVAEVGPGQGAGPDRPSGP